MEADLTTSQGKLPLLGKGAISTQQLHRDVLSFAYARCKANGGAAGVDGQTFDDIEAYGSQDRKSEDRKTSDIETDWNPWLEELAQELRDKTYRPQAVRRVYIPKPNSKKNATSGDRDDTRPGCSDGGDAGA